jgi:uncharacterized C2H2 Zn-finger protein
MVYSSQDNEGYHLFRCDKCDIAGKATRSSGKYKVYICQGRLYLRCLRCGDKRIINTNL